MSGNGWLHYRNQKATRNRPLNDKLIAALSFLPELGVSMHVTSGGQVTKEEAEQGKGNRVGSVRHDHGNAADVDFYMGDRKLSPKNANDRAILTQIVQRGKANGITGWGEGDDYMGSGRMHLGFGKPGVWGAKGKLTNAPQWLRDAYNGGGMSASLAPPTNDAAYSLATGERRVYQEPGELTPDPETASISQLQSDAWNTQQTLPWLYERLTYEPERDPNWQGGSDTKLIEQTLKENNLPAEKYAEWVAGSSSKADFDYKVSKAINDYDRHQRLAQAGAKGTALSIANAILDPVALVADVAASSVIPGYVFGSGASRVGRVMQAGLSGAAGGAAAEGVAVAVNPNRNSADVLMGTAFGFGVGSVIGSLSQGANSLAEAKALSRAAKQTIAEYEAASIPSASSVGAAQVSRNKPWLDEEGIGAVQHNELSDHFMRSFRYDLSSIFDRSKSTVTRMLGGALVQNAGGSSGLAVVGKAASEEVTLFSQQWMTSFNQTYTPQFSAYRKRMGILPGSPKAHQLELEFNEKVAAYIRDRRPGRNERHADPEVRFVGDKIAQIQSEILDMAKNPFIREGLSESAIKGMETVANDPHYLMRRWSADKIRALDQKYGSQALEDLIFGAMRSANADLQDAIVRKAAKGFTTAIRNRGHGITEAMGRPIGADNFDILKKALVEEGGLEPAAADTFLKNFTKQPDAGRDPRAKRRVLMDENWEMTHASPDIRTNVVDSAPLKIADLLDNDAASLFHDYSRQMAGQIALARVRIKDPSTGELLVNGIKSESDFNRLVELAKKSGADNGASPKEIQRDVNMLQYAYDAIRGRAHKGENTGYGNFLRLMRKFHFARVMGQVGFAQVPELARIVSTLGVKAAFSQLPTFKRVYRDATGETILKDPLMQDIEKVFGLGGERLNYRSNYRRDDLTGGTETSSGSLNAERLLDQAGRVVSEASGMTQINILSQRWAGAGIVQKFSDWAASGKGISKKRLTDLGLDKEMAERVRTMMTSKGNLEFEKGVITGNRVARLNMDNWADKEAAEAFVFAVHRWSGQIIQRNDIGALIPYMNNPFAKMIFQFRTFIMGAYANQTIKGINMTRHGDPTEIAAAFLATATAALVFTAQTKVQAIGRGDAEEFLEKRLSWDSLAAAGFSRAGWASILPMIYDTGAAVAGADQAFMDLLRKSGEVFLS